MGRISCTREQCTDVGKSSLRKIAWHIARRSGYYLVSWTTKQKSRTGKSTGSGHRIFIPPSPKTSVVFQPIPREKVLEVINRLGPVQPLDVKRDLKEGDTVLIGAILSEMTGAGVVAVTNLKRGGSPFYYDPNDPPSLEKVSQYLNEKDNRTYNLLRNKKGVAL